MFYLETYLQFSYNENSPLTEKLKILYLVEQDTWTLPAYSIEVLWRAEQWRRGFANIWNCLGCYFNISLGGNKKHIAELNWEKELKYSVVCFWINEYETLSTENAKR
jgi:hypothetical protein